MLPFFPSLRPPIANRIWFDSAANEEAEVLKYEREHHSWVRFSCNLNDGSTNEWFNESKLVHV